MNPLYYSFLYFYHMDHANACIHQASVKFSPITFELAQQCIDQNIHTPGITPYSAAIEVISQKGKYPLDHGR